MLPPLPAHLRLLSFVLSAALLSGNAVGQSAGSQVYKLVDEEGRVTYTNVPERGVAGKRYLAIPVGEAGGTPSSPAGRDSRLERTPAVPDEAPMAVDPGKLPQQVLTFTTQSSAQDLRCGNSGRRPPSSLHSPPPQPASPAGSRGVSEPRPHRIAIWGDSHVSGDVLISEVVRSLEANGRMVRQLAFPLVAIQPGSPHFLRMACLPPEEWESVATFRAAKPVATGPSLMTLYSTTTGSRLALDLRDRAGARAQETAVLRYTPLKVGTSLAISIDGGAEQVVRLFGDADPGGRLAELVVRANGPIATMSVRVASGTLALQAIVLPPSSPDAPAIDVFGLRSATVHGWSHADPKVIQAALSGIQYDTVILAYGTNEGAGSLYQRDTYLKDLRRAAANFRAVFPTQSCLMAGPPDRGVTRPTDGTAAPQALFYSSRHREISRAQEQVAKEFRCQFWDWQADMGGPGSSYAWARMTPPLMQADLTHLTGDGYRRSGLALARALKLSRGP